MGIAAAGNVCLGLLRTLSQKQGIPGLGKVILLEVAQMLGCTFHGTKSAVAGSASLSLSGRLALDRWSGEHI